MPSAVINGAALQIPVLLTSAFFGNAATGLFNVAYQISGAPLRLFSLSFSPVLFQRISSGDEGDIYPLVRATAIRLGLATLPAIAVVSVFGPGLFSMVFGPEWREAGEVARLLILSVSIRFVVSPLSVVLSLHRHVRLGFVRQVFALVLVTCTLCCFRHLPFPSFIRVFVLQDLLSYLLYLLLILHAARKG